MKRSGFVLGTALAVAFGAAAAAGGDAPRTGTIRGVVHRDEDDLPEPGRSVTLLTDGAEPRKALTDSWGRFTFDAVPAGVRCELRVEADDCATVRDAELPLLPGETRDTGELWLGPPNEVKVVALDETGSPVAGAAVEAFRAPGGTLGEYASNFRLDLARVPVVTATTDDSGRAVLALPQGQIWTVAAEAPGRARAAAARIGEHRRSTVTLELPRGERLTGRVVGPDGRPAAGALVLARKSVDSWGTCGTCSPHEVSAELWQRATTDGEGRYAFASLAPAKIEVCAAAAGTLPSAYRCIEFPTIATLDLALRRSATIAGRLTDATSGAPVAGVSLSVQIDYGAALAVSDADGRYALEGLCADSRVYVVTLPPRGWTGVRFAFEGRDELSLAWGQRVVIDGTVQHSATLAGRVLENGVPVPHADVSVATLPESGDNLWGRSASARADATGAYRLEDVLPGRVVVVACRPGDDDQRAWKEMYDREVKDRIDRPPGGFDVAAGATLTRDLEIGRWPKEAAKARELRAESESTATVRFQVATGDGRPLVNAKWFRDTDFDRTERRRSAWWIAVPPGGVVSFGAAEGESVQIAAWDDRHGLARATVRGTKDESAPPVRVVLPALPATRVRVVSDGAPVAGVSVSLDGVLVARTSSDGEASVGMETGDSLGVAAEGFVGHSWNEPPAALEGVVVLEIERAGVIAGLVVDASGRSVAGLVVSPAKSGASSVTDTDGRFRLEGLPSAKQSVRVESAPGSPDVATVITDPVAVGATDLRIEVVPERPIAGVVTSADGRPVGNATVYCRPGAGGVERTKIDTDDRGRFRFRGVAAGAHWLFVEPNRSDELVPQRRRVAADDEHAQEVSFRLERAATITGVVKMPDGSIAPRNEIKAVRTGPKTDEPLDWPWDMEDWADEKTGEFRLVVPPGSTFRLELGYGELSRRAILRGGEEVASGAAGLVLTADTGVEISGVVVDEEGRPIEKADVDSRLSFSDERSARTGADGRFALTGLVAGKFPLVVRADGFAPVRIKDVAAGTKELRVPLVKGLTIKGRLLAKDGGPAKGFSVRAVSPQWPGDDFWSFSPEADGTFEIRNLPAGSWYVESFQRRCGPPAQVVTHGEFKAGATGIELKRDE